MSRPDFEDRKAAVQAQRKAVEERNRQAGMSERKAKEEAEKAINRAVNRLESDDWR